MNDEKIDYNAAGWGCLGMLLVLGLVISCVLPFFGGSHVWPIVFLLGIIALAVRYQIRARKNNKV